MQKNKIYSDIAVIGGGASGMTAAISAGRMSGKLHIIIAEACPRVGKKLLTTGNGQCNLSNSGALDSHYHGSSDFALRLLENGQKNAEDFFESIGVVLTRDSAGRMYPYSRQASAVLDALRFECDRLKIVTKCGAAVSSVKKENGVFILETEDGIITAERVILASGGKAAAQYAETGYEIANKLGHTVTEVYPSIVQLKTETEKIRAFKGIKIDAEASFLKNGQALQTEKGELLFTEYGVSGPCVMQLSRNASFAGKSGEIEIDFCPDIEEKSLKSILSFRKEICKDREPAEFLNGFLNKRIGQTLVKQTLGAKPVSKYDESDIDRLCEAIKKFRLKITGTTGWSHAQAMAGG
ncbi:MAG: aminoacetone oxidase family FAD-binding enzyme, partial [Acutalibacteraceae bacterium]